MLETKKNPLLTPETNPAADIAHLRSPTTIRRPLVDRKRQLKDARRAEAATEALGTLDRTSSVFGYSKGQFSFIDLMKATLEQTGPADLAVSTWTASGTGVQTVLDLCESGLVRSSRWLVDFSFAKRSPALAHALRERFGDDCIRVCPNHAKFALIGNDAWKVVIRTSMNLNENPRFENFEVGHDPDLYDFHKTFLDELWQKQRRADADMRPYDIIRQFRTSL